MILEGPWFCLQLLSHFRWETEAGRNSISCPGSRSYGVGKPGLNTLVSLTLNQVCYFFDYKKLNYQCPLEEFTVYIRKDDAYVHRKITQQYKEAQKGRGNTIERHGTRIESLTWYWPAVGHWHSNLFKLSLLACKTKRLIMNSFKIHLSSKS